MLDQTEVAQVSHHPVIVATCRVEVSATISVRVTSAACRGHLWAKGTDACEEVRCNCAAVDCLCGVQVTHTPAKLVCEPNIGMGVFRMFDKTEKGLFSTDPYAKAVIDEVPEKGLFSTESYAKAVIDEVPPGKRLTSCHV